MDALRFFDAVTAVHDAYGVANVAILGLGGEFGRFVAHCCCIVDR